jgi:hypothetical protein
MLRLLKYKYVNYGLLTIAVLAIVSYGIDGLLLHYRGTPHADLRVDSMYKMKNRWNEIEYSVGSTGTQRCVKSLYPHGGFSPCWYLTRHAMNYIQIGELHTNRGTRDRSAGD